MPHAALYRYLRGIFLTSLVGSIATMPFAIFTFDRATHYAVLGNLLAMPVMGFVVMPGAALGVIAMPFGWEALPLHVMGWGIDVMLAMGRFVAGLPGAVTVSRAWPVGALAAMSLGGLWLALWRTGWRWLGAIPVLAGIAIALMTKPPDMLVTADARTIAIRASDNHLMFPRPPKDRFAATRWLARDGDARTIKEAVGGARCDGESCVMTAPDGSRIAMPSRPEDVAEDCAHAAIILSAVTMENCTGPKLVLDLRTIASGGGYAITDGKPLSVRQWRGDRPWVQ